LRRFGSEDLLEIGARRRRSPTEQDAHHAREPAFRLRGWGRHQHRERMTFASGRSGAG
jgi:hypothetical protein